MNDSHLPALSRSLTKKHLTDDLFRELQNTATDSGFTLAKAIRSNIENPDSSIGIYAGDSQSYQTFSKVFEPIILEYHGLTRGQRHVTDIQPVNVADPDPEKQFIVSTRVRVARNVHGFNFTSHLALESRKHLEQTIVTALKRCQGELKGEYCSFENLQEDKARTLREKKLLFTKGDRFQDAAGINSHYPQGRGIFYSMDKRLRVWINEEDHMRIISQATSSDLASVFNRLCKTLLVLESTLTFAKDDTYGHLTSCPTNLGTAMRAGVHIRLPQLNRNRSLLDDLVESHHLQIRGTSGEKTKIDNAVFDISNRRRLGITETSIIKELHRGLLAIIEAERELS